MKGGKMKNLSTRIIAVSAGLAAFSAALQLIHIGYQSPQWGMWIDLVSVSWLIAFFLFGVKSSFLVSLLGAIIITLFAPDTWLGASMKWLATFPMWGSFFLWSSFSKTKLADFQKVRNLLPPLFIGLFIRCLLIIPINYYYAIPIWTGMTPDKAMSIIPWYIIAVFNIIQGILDVFLAWIIVFRFRLNRFATWE